MGHLNDLSNEFSRFIKNPELQTAFNSLAELVQEENKFNLRAMIETGNIETKTADICDLNYIDDYEILTGSFNVTLSDGWEGNTEEERDEKLEELRNRLDELESQFADDDENEELVQQIDTLKDDIDTLECAEFEYDEVMWNTVWQFGWHKVDQDLAQELGLAVVRFNYGEHEDENFIALIGCGMDLSPKLIAYKALEYGFVDPSDVSKFDDISYFKHVVGTENFNAVVEKLGIKDCIETAEQEEEQRMKDFNDKIDKISTLRQSGELDQITAGLLALTAYAKSNE